MAMTADRPKIGLPEVYLTPAQVAEQLPGVTENALAIWRHRRQGPPFCRLGRTVVYPLEPLTLWVASHTFPGGSRGR